MKKLSELYPQYYKGVPEGVSADEVDTYVINLMFPVDDYSGCILHARKKLLIPGVRSGGKSRYKDVKEARDTLNRYLQLMEPVRPMAEPVTEPAKPEEKPLEKLSNSIPELQDMFKELIEKTAMDKSQVKPLLKVNPGISSLQLKPVNVEPTDK